MKCFLSLSKKHHMPSNHSIWARPQGSLLWTQVYLCIHCLLPPVVSTWLQPHQNPTPHPHLIQIYHFSGGDIFLIYQIGCRNGWSRSNGKITWNSTLDEDNIMGMLCKTCRPEQPHTLSKMSCGSALSLLFNAFLTCGFGCFHRKHLKC